MAELLGVVAGGAGLLSLAGQLLEATEKLRRFCQTFKGRVLDSSIYTIC